MRIVKLQAENVKRLKAVEISPTGELVVIGGRNAQGKSSILDAIEMALGGKDSIPDMPIRRGEKSARVILELDGPEGLKIVRRFTEKDSYIEVKRPNGGKVGAPQALLDSLCSRVAFDPISWIRERPDKQAETLRRLVGLDFRTADQERKRLYDQRTEANRIARQEQAAADAIPVVDAPAEPVSVADLMTELRRRQDQNRDIEATRQRADAANVRCRRLIQEGNEIKAEIERLNRRLAEMRDEYNESLQAQTGFEVQLAEMRFADTAEVEQQIRDSEQVNESIRQNQARKQREATASKYASEADKLTEAIDRIDADKAAALAAAKWPIPGLGFDGDHVTFQGLPLDQASSAEQTRIAVAIGLALNPKLPVVLIRDGSLLDDQSLAAVAAQAAAANAQVWIERVGKGAECSVIIEDGEIA